MRKKVICVTLVTMLLSLTVIFPSLGAGWQLDNTGWWWQNDDGSYPVSSWQWLDDNADGFAECYYFNDSGYIITNSVTSDGYTVNDKGQYVIDGIVQTKIISSNSAVTVVSSDAAISTNTSSLPTNPNDLVWIPATGKKFHSIPNCGNMNPEKAKQITYEEALDKNYIACDNCYQ